MFSCLLVLSLLVDIADDFMRYADAPGAYGRVATDSVARPEPTILQDGRT